LRAQGRLSAAFERSPEGRTHAASLEEAGGYRMRFPNVHVLEARGAGGAGHTPCEGTIINTGGGMAGGDRLAIKIEAGRGSHVVLSTPSAERIYGSTGLVTEAAIVLHLEAAARLAWLPRETILFSGARLARRLDVEMEASATLILAETIVFGRLAMGERLGRGLFADSWRIKRSGRLLHAEEARLDGDIGRLLDRPALAGGARAMATAIMVAPDAEDKLDAARSSLLGARCACGASAWDGMLVGRFLAKDPATLRVALARFLHVMTGGHLPYSLVDRDALARTADRAIEWAAGSMPDWQDWGSREVEIESDPAREG
jgi:urease accessory protein